MKKVIGYNVIDNQTKSVIKTYPEGQGKSARNFANKKDLAYGAIRYVVTFIWSE